MSNQENRECKCHCHIEACNSPELWHCEHCKPDAFSKFLESRGHKVVDVTPDKDCPSCASPLPPQKEDWEKEFDNSWIDESREGYFDPRTTKREVKSFIHQVIAKERKDKKEKLEALEVILQLSTTTKDQAIKVIQDFLSLTPKDNGTL